MTKQIGAATVPRSELRGLTALYHVWFSPVRRIPALDGDIAAIVAELLRTIASEKGIELLQCQTAFDHAHLLLKPAEGMTLARAVQLLKRHIVQATIRAMPELKLDMQSSHFWQRGYGFRRVPPGATLSIARYIRRHRSEVDRAADFSPWEINPW